jgi:hypothetical protein
VESGLTNGVLAPDAGAALGEFDVIKSLTKDGWGDTVMLVAEGPTEVSIVDMKYSFLSIDGDACIPKHGMLFAVYGAKLS